jgi:hypothetical protein
VVLAVIYGPYRSHASTMHAHVVLQVEEPWDGQRPPKTDRTHKRRDPRYFVRALERALRAWMGRR